ncbi:MULTISPECIES: AbrB/MazE/SpoVT family DNA-binding domain-containing protein [Oceanobacillus]|uniref:AbrB/MazE/SpoVT family DNA-binding domain-containing protein n=1 Tax=Oceanobacillus aidingensis TaxID=645964 RepID=A0ABV9JUT4_9BACI|nr:AbrB/MazE/SpoVT family DNA-binding domain-containing protein [Oceanobacillus oncorhynchi]MDM8099005.1 AbrB/MazE/SpoVT family DNA-binding domain-containing protein [Oceanobacillus oncorhynchi]UUI39784.1 AbrB/MazE/SpoVT family DNA-binding domain-containing protein [Oceanobacillus oncorhynchi]
MKSTGIVRKVDELGRIVIPKELRRSLNIQERDPMEIFVEEDRIIIRKYEAEKTCFITGEVNDDNIQLPGGLYVSQKGKEILKEYL